MRRKKDFIVELRVSWQKDRHTGSEDQLIFHQESSTFQYQKYSERGDQSQEEQSCPAIEGNDD